MSRPSTGLSADALAYYWDHAYDFVCDLIVAPAARNMPGFRVTPQQKQALDEISKYPRVSIESGHGVGKSSTFSWIACWFIMTRNSGPLNLPVKVPILAPTYHQLKDIIWPEFSRWIPLSCLNPYLTIQKDEVFIPGQQSITYIRGRSPQKEDAVQGFHAPHLLWIIDEAFGLTNEKVWVVIEGSMTQPDNKIIMAGQHTQITGYVHDTFGKDSKNWRNLRFNSEDSPIADKKFIERIIVRYGKDSDVYRVRVQGMPPKGNPDSFISLSKVAAAMMRDVEIKGPVRIGVDPARFGDDSTVVTIACGNHVFPQISKSDTDTDAIVSMVVGAIRKYRSEYQDLSIISVRIDTTGGYGAGAFDALKKMESELRIDVMPVVFTGKISTVVDPENYDGVTRLYADLRNQIDVLHLPPSDDLTEELSARKYSVALEDGRTKLETKADFKSEHGVSPDHADSLVLCVAEGALPTMVLDRFSSREVVGDFNVGWDAVTEHSKLVVGIWSNEAMASHCLLGLWNARLVKLWIFGEMEFSTSRPDTIMPGLSMYVRLISEQKIQNLNGWEIYGNQAMFRKDDNDMAEVYQKYGYYLQENEYWEERGAILMIGRLSQRKGLKIHPRCERLISDCGKWQIRKSVPAPGFCFARCLCNLASVCAESSRFDPVQRPMKKYSRQSVEFQETVKRLANSGVLDSMTDDEILDIVENGETEGDRLSWMG